MKTLPQCLLFLMLGLGSLAAQGPPAESGMALAESAIDADFENAVVRVVYDALATPLVRTYLNGSEVSAEEFLIRRRSTDGFRLPLESAAPESRRAEIQLTLRPDQRLRLEGDRIDLEILLRRSGSERSRPAGEKGKLLDGARSKPIPRGASGLEVGLRDSVAALKGVTPERLIAVTSSIQSDLTRSTLALELEDSGRREYCSRPHLRFRRGPGREW